MFQRGPKRERTHQEKSDIFQKGVDQNPYISILLKLLQKEILNFCILSGDQPHNYSHLRKNSIFTYLQAIEEEALAERKFRSLTAKIRILCSSGNTCTRTSPDQKLTLEIINSNPTNSF